jgi:hypothetical protein
VSDQCRSCGAPVVWAKLSSGKNNPVDPKPSPDGNIILGAAGDVSYVLSRIEAVAYKGLLHRSHFSTCPNAAAHRRR